MCPVSPCSILNSMETGKLLCELRRGLTGRARSHLIAKSYLYWARAFLLFFDGRDLSALGREDLDTFMRHLAMDRYASAATRTQALKAIELLYARVFEMRPPWIENYLRERLSGTGPTVLSPEEVQRLLSHLEGLSFLIAALCYGSGLRLLECVRLRNRDLDIPDGRILVHGLSGTLKRHTMLPQTVLEPLKRHLEIRRAQHIEEVASGYGQTALPEEVARRQPNLARSWQWQYLFLPVPGSGRRSSTDHVSETVIRRRFSLAASEANIMKQIGNNTLRNSFAVHLIQSGVAMSTVERLLGTGAYRDMDAGTLARLSGETMPSSPLDRLRVH